MRLFLKIETKSSSIWLLLTEDLVAILTLAFLVSKHTRCFWNAKSKPTFNMTLFEGGSRCQTENAVVRCKCKICRFARIHLLWSSVPLWPYLPRCAILAGGFEVPVRLSHGRSQNAAERKQPRPGGVVRVDGSDSRGTHAPNEGVHGVLNITILPDWIFCAGIFLLVEYFVLNILLTEYYILEYPYRLTEYFVLNILTD